MVVKSEARRGQAPSLIVIHTNEGNNPAGVYPDLGAENLARWLDSENHAGRSKSYHVIIDDDSIVHYVPDTAASWAIPGGNRGALNLCFIGWARWSRTEWLTHSRMLRLGAEQVRRWCATHGLPAVKLTPSQVGAGVRGVCGHVDWTRGKKMGNHTDPGEGFPWPEFMTMVGGTTAPTTHTAGPEAEATALHILEDNMIQNIPLIGEGAMPLLCPVGSKSADGRDAWVAASTLGLTGVGWVQVYVQGDGGGIADWKWTEKELRQSSSNLLTRPEKVLPDGTTKLVVSWDLRNAQHGGVLCLQTRPRR